MVPLAPSICPRRGVSGPLCEASPSTQERDVDQDGRGDACDGGTGPCEYQLGEWIVYGNAYDACFATVTPTGIRRRSGWGADAAETETLVRVLDETSYELADHLGNVRVVTSDLKEPTVQSGAHHFEAQVRAYNHYYPFGTLEADRSWGTADYRWGYNGKEMDNEVRGTPGAGTGGSYDYGFRIYDARVARFMSVDPLAADYPGWSPYPFAMDRPIDGIDLDG